MTPPPSETDLNSTRIATPGASIEAEDDLEAINDIDHMIENGKLVRDERRGGYAEE